MKKQAAALLIAGATVALGGGLAMALDEPPRPVVVEEETIDDTTVDDTTVDDTEVDDESEDTESEDEAADTEADDADGADAAEHPENHGLFVSEAAREGCAEAENHGECVSEVAHSDAGKSHAPNAHANGNAED